MCAKCTTNLSFIFKEQRRVNFIDFQGLPDKDFIFIFL